MEGLIGKTVLIATTMFVFLATVALHAGSEFDLLPVGSKRYYEEISPAGWTAMIWACIYIWQVLWLVYELVNTFRSKSAVNYGMPSLVFGGFILNNLCDAILFLFKMRNITLIPIILLALFALYICLFFSYRLLNPNMSFIKSELHRYIWVSRLLTQNGIACYASWTTIATFLNSVMVFSYGYDANIVAVSIIAALMCVWFIVDICILDKYLRYTYSPYIVGMLAFAGVAQKYYAEKNVSIQDYVFIWVLLLGVPFLFLASLKLCIAVWRHYKVQTQDNMSSNTMS